jgi:hypothetical protein
VHHTEPWLLATKGRELRKAKSLRTCLNTVAHVARTWSTALSAPEQIRTHHKIGIEYVPRNTHYRITVRMGLTSQEQVLKVPTMAIAQDF